MNPLRITLLGRDEAPMQRLAAHLDRAGYEPSVLKANGSAVPPGLDPQASIVVLFAPAGIADVAAVAASRAPSPAIVLLGAPEAPAFPPAFTLDAMRAGAQEVVAGDAQPAEIESAILRAAARKENVVRPRGGQCISFMPCKGGSGASFLAANFAWYLSEHARVLLVDLNMQFGDTLAMLHSGKAPGSIADLCAAGARLDRSLLASAVVPVRTGLGVLASPEDPRQALGIQAEQVDAVLALALSEYDFLVLDLPRCMDASIVPALDRSVRVHLVMQQSVPHVRNAARMLAAFRGLGYLPGKTELIVNRFDRASAVSPTAIRRALAMNDGVMHTVPNAWHDVSASIDAGDALVSVARTSRVARGVAGIAAPWLGATAAAPFQGFLQRIFTKP
jgi:pilus assembly protein CpaE